MTSMPETRYAKSGDLHIAYQVMGSGPLDVVLVPGFVTRTARVCVGPANLHCQDQR
jgi:hypothetical protein